MHASARRRRRRAGRAGHAWAALISRGLTLYARFQVSRRPADRRSQTASAASSAAPPPPRAAAATSRSCVRVKRCMSERSAWRARARTRLGPRRCRVGYGVRVEGHAGCTGVGHRSMDRSARHGMRGVAARGAARDSAASGPPRMPRSLGSGCRPGPQQRNGTHAVLRAALACWLTGGTRRPQLSEGGACRLAAPCGAAACELQAAVRSCGAGRAFGSSAAISVAARSTAPGLRAGGRRQSRRHAARTRSRDSDSTANWRLAERAAHPRQGGPSHAQAPPMQSRHTRRKSLPFVHCAGAGAQEAPTKT